jgi:predicted O-methyltransferase YrrM
MAPGAPAIPTAVTREEVEALGGFAKDRDCLEIGSAYGFSAIMMILLGAKSVTAIDFHQPCDSNEQAKASHEAMRKNLKWFKVDHAVTIIRQSSQEALPDLAAQGKQYGLAFIDGDHSYESVRHDVSKAMQLVPDGFIACHDYGEDGIEDVTRAVDEIFPGGPDYRIGTLCVVKVPVTGKSA